MSWPLAAFSLVALVLALGWLAYERARPSARMVAVVATLAAVAALGRDAFVALPDVKPITAITLAVGYALGPLPGFTVGALGMLASNILLGQGPYTPWQMAAWGLVGLAGAALGRLSGRRLGRVGLALACAFAALGAKEVMNVYTWTVGASHTPSAFLLIAGTALPFDVTDVVASLLFGLAFAPELVRLLTRMRARMHVSWEAGEMQRGADDPAAPADGRSLAAWTSAAVLLAAVATALAGTSLGGLGSSPAAASRASGAAASGSARAVAGVAPVGSQARAGLGGELSFLLSAQNADGGFGGARGQGSSELYTAWAAMAVAATGYNPATVRRGGRSVLDSLRGQAYTLQGVGDAERTILAAHACRASAYSFAGRHLVSEMMRARAPDHSFAEQVNLTAFAIFAMRAIGHSAAFGPIRDAAGWIERQRNEDGGFAFSTGGLQRCRRHGRGVAGAGRLWRSQQARARARHELPDRGAEPRRRVSAAARGAVKRPIDRVGCAGPDRGRTEPQLGPSPRKPLSAGLPGKSRLLRWRHAVFAHQRADAGVGHRPGADRTSWLDFSGRLTRAGRGLQAQLAPAVRFIRSLAASVPWSWRCPHTLTQPDAGHACTRPAPGAAPACCRRCGSRGSACWRSR